MLATAGAATALQRLPTRCITRRLARKLSQRLREMQAPGRTREAAEVILLHVIAPTRDHVLEDGERIALDEQWGRRETRDPSDCGISRVSCSRLEWRDLNVRGAVEHGIAGGHDSRFRRALAAEWIVLSTHGRSGVRRWVYGSVAAKVLRAARTTVVLVRAGWPGAEAAK